MPLKLSIAFINVGMFLTNSASALLKTRRSHSGEVETVQIVVVSRREPANWGNSCEMVMVRH